MEKPTLWKSLHYKYCSCNLGFKITGNITSVLCLQGFSFILLLLFLIGWFSAFNLMQLLYVWKCLSFCVEQPPSFCVQCITNGKFYSFLKILNQAKTKIWFFLSHWDDDIFLSCSLPSEWCFHILLWQERENKLSENLLLTSWQILTENWAGKLTVSFFELQKDWWMWECWVNEGVCRTFSKHGTRLCVCAGGDDVSINAWVSETLNKLKVTAWDRACSTSEINMWVL